MFASWLGSACLPLSPKGGKLFPHLWRKVEGRNCVCALAPTLSEVNITLTHLHCHGGTMRGRRAAVVPQGSVWHTRTRALSPPDSHWSPITCRHASAEISPFSAWHMHSPYLRFQPSRGLRSTWRATEALCTEIPATALSCKMQAAHLRHTTAFALEEEEWAVFNTPPPPIHKCTQGQKGCEGNSTPKGCLALP